VRGENEKSFIKKINHAHRLSYDMTVCIFPIERSLLFRILILEKSSRLK